jgi:hypothetical protein
VGRAPQAREIARGPAPRPARRGSRGCEPVCATPPSLWISEEPGFRSA